MPSWPVSCRRRSKALSILSITAQAVKTKEVSTWQYPREKYPSKDATRDAAPCGSWRLPVWWLAPSAVRCICLTECARSAVPTMAVRSSRSSPWPLANNDRVSLTGGKHGFPPAFLFGGGKRCCMTALPAWMGYHGRCRSMVGAAAWVMPCHGRRSLRGGRRTQLRKACRHAQNARRTRLITNQAQGRRAVSPALYFTPSRPASAGSWGGNAPGNRSAPADENHPVPALSAPPPGGTPDSRPSAPPDI